MSGRCLSTIRKTAPIVLVCALFLLQVQACKKNPPEAVFYVHYHSSGAEGGTVPKDSSAYKRQSEIRIAANTGGLYRSGHSFAGWNTRPDGSGTDMAADSPHTIGSEDLHLYALWAPEYPVTFNKNDPRAEGVMPMQYIGQNQTASLNACTFSLSDYVFAGWALRPAAQAIYSNRAPFSMGAEAIHVYAVWKFRLEQSVMGRGNTAFTMSRVPGGYRFPGGTDDAEQLKVQHSFWAGTTPVSYQLWRAVYDWATHEDRGDKRYIFSSQGNVGNTRGGGKSVLHPVTRVNWHSAMVWCNALTEWYNAQHKSSLECVYTHGESIIRNAMSTRVCDNARANLQAGGFRLPEAEEWELAARWSDDGRYAAEGYVRPWFTRGDAASGAAASYKDYSATGVVAVYNANSGNSTAPVASKQPNSLGLFDMSGNVWEWCFSGSPNQRVYRGGSWYSHAENLRIGFVNRINPDFSVDSVGFRIVRSDR